MSAKLSYNAIQREATYNVRDALRANIIARTYNLWLSSRISSELTPSQTLYIMKKLWYEGRVGAWPMMASVGDVKALLGFAPFVASAWNMYDEPTAGTLINSRGVAGIPSSVLRIGKDVVVGYAMPDHCSSVFSVCKAYFDKIVDDEMAIYKEIQSLKKTRIFSASPDTYKQVEQEMRAIDSDQAFGVVSSPEPGAITAVIGNTDGSVLQELYNARTKDENALNTFLGFDNVGSFEKKERMNDGEVEQNTAIITDYSDSIQKNLDDFADEVAKAFGEEYRFALIPTNAPSADEPSDESADGAEGDDNGKR